MKIVVNKENIRIDKYLKENTKYSREYITKLIKENNVLVNNKNVKPSYQVRIDDLIIIKEIKENSKVIPVKMNLEIVYEDDYLMVINKQSGLVVHPGYGNKDNTLVNGLLYYTTKLSDIAGEERRGIVHRLDKNTSGLMIVCKDNKTHELLQKDFQAKKIYREYYALLVGQFKNDSAFIDAPIGRSKKHFQQMEVKEGGREAQTNLKVIKRYKDYTLVSLVLNTGRTHQIRAHMKYIGYPIYNDPVYTNSKTTSFGQFLHSKIIKFNHPITNKKIELEIPLPKYFQDFINKLD